MRVVLDTNVLLSALISPHGAPDAIYRAWRASRFELVTSTEQLDELRRVSRYPKLKTILPAHRVGAMVNNMQRAVVLDHLPPPPEHIVITDPNYWRSRAALAWDLELDDELQLALEKMLAIKGSLNSGDESQLITLYRTSNPRRALQLMVGGW